MAPLLLKHLASSLSRQAIQMSRITVSFSSPAANTYRRFCSLVTAPCRLLPSLSRVQYHGPVQPLSSSPGCSALWRPSLLGQCQLLPCIQPSAGMKTKTALKRRCKDCFFVRRRGHLFVFCKTNPRHKQRQG
uniref:Ribosomal protein n=1 Tax=Sphaeramia orbicularis TaxID=375764 RepID=A0A673A7Z2_9TELE